MQELQDMRKSLNCIEPLTVIVVPKKEGVILDGEDRVRVTVKRGRALCPWVKQAKPTKVKEFILPEKVFVRQADMANAATKEEAHFWRFH